MLSGCIGISDTWQVYNLALLEKELKITPTNPGRFLWDDGEASYQGALSEGQEVYKAFQYGICQDVFYLFEDKADKPERANRVTGGTLADGSQAPTKADAVLGVANEENMVEMADVMSNTTDLSSYTSYYTFGNPKFQTYNQDAEGMYQSFSLKFDSKQACATDPTKKFSMIFDLTCDPDQLEGFEWYGPIYGGAQAFADYECERYFEYSGPQGCETATIKGVKTFEKFIGVIALVAGLVLCFYGAAILPIALGFLVFFLVTGFVMGLGNVLTDYYSGSMTPILSFAAVGAICGAVASYCFTKIYKEWGSALLALFGGLIVSMLLLMLVNLSATVQIILAVIICSIFVFIGKKYDNYIKAYGTAGVGAFLTVYGIASFFDMAPSLSQAQEFEPGQIGIIVGWIVLFIAGAVVQKKYLAHKAGDVFSADV